MCLFLTFAHIKLRTFFAFDFNPFSLSYIGPVHSFIYFHSLYLFVIIIYIIPNQCVRSDSDLTQARRRRRRRGRLLGKKVFLFYSRISYLFELFSVSVVMKTFRLAEYDSSTFNSRQKYEKLAVVVHVLQRTQNLVNVKKM